MNKTRELLQQSKLREIKEKDLFTAMCLDLSEYMDADLVSIWFFDAALSRLDCQLSYDALTGNFENGQQLFQEDHPVYFSNIVEYNFILAPNATTHYATKELAEKYLIPQKVKSIIDFILHRDFKPIGVICCENRRVQRNWSEEDKNYLRAIAALVSSRFHFS